MAYRLIKGAFHLFYTGQRFVGSRPDGDSVWFKPDDKSFTEDLGGRDVDFNRGDYLPPTDLAS